MREDEAVPVFFLACCSLWSWLMQVDASTFDSKPQKFSLVFGKSVSKVEVEIQMRFPQSESLSS